MPAQIVLAHDDAAFVESSATALRNAGYTVATFGDSMSAINALDRTQHIELLITRIRFPEGTPNGVALARMARVKRRGIKILFTAAAETQEHAEGVGEFLMMPASTGDVVATVRRMLDEEE